MKNSVQRNEFTPSVARGLRRRRAGFGTCHACGQSSAGTTGDSSLTLGMN